MAAMTGGSLKEMLARAHGYLRGYERQFAVLGAVAIVASLFEIAVLVIIVPLVQGIADESEQVALDSLGPLDEFHLSVGALILMGLGLICARLVAQMVLAHLRARLNADWDEHLRLRLFGAYLGAEWSVQSDEQSTQVQELLTGHLGSSQAILAALSNAWVASFSLCVLLVAALFANPAGALAITVFTVFMLVAMRPLAHRAQRKSIELSTYNLAYVRTIGDATNLTREIRTFDVMEPTKQAFSDQIRVIHDLRQRVMFLGASVSSLYQNLILALVLIGLGVIYVIDATQLPSLAVVVLILIRSMSYSQTVSGAMHTISESGPYLERITDAENRFLDNPVELKGGTPLDRIDTIEFCQVSYRYGSESSPPDTAERSAPALDEVTFRAYRNQMIGVVGPSGSGKSTLVQLLLGLRLPTSGVLELNGVDATSVARSSWFRRVSYVAQEARLLDGSVADNIRFRRPGVDHHEIEQAARRAYLHEEILSWPDGYDTAVGEGGSHISGGQRQRICIARALVGDPDVVVFDEPTSSLDVHSEWAIQRTLDELRRDRLVVIVAHRLSTLDRCDHLLVLLAGRLAAFGPAEETASNSPWYAEAVALSNLRTDRETGATTGELEVL